VKFFLNGCRAAAGILQKGSYGWATAVATGALMLAGPAAHAQLAQEPFGRVRIQYKNLNWQFYSTQNFNVYFYGGGEASARRAAEYAEQELQRITALVGYYPYSKTTLMLYNSVGDLRQSNIGLPSPNSVNGGEAQLARMSKVEIAFGGRQTDFKREMSFQITQVLLNDMMYGGSLREVLQSNYLLQLPDWFVGGASAYAAEGWSVEMDGYMRDMVRQYPTGNRTAPFFVRNSRLAGQSIWNYVAERYGYGAVQNILNLTRITRDVEVGISSSLNVPFKIFLRNWVNYYRGLNTQPAIAALGQPADAARRSSRNRRGLELFSQPVLSPDGQRVAYAVNDQGRFRVVVANRDGSHRHVLMHNGYKTPEQQIEGRLPALAWHGNGQVAVAELSRGKMALRLHDANGDGIVARLRGAIRISRPTSVFDTYDQVLDLNYSPDGKSLVFSAIKNGQNDIYLLKAGSRQPEKLTDDLFDDQQAVFMPNGQAIVFSSNRYLDSTGRARPASFPNVVNNYDLFIYHLDGRAKPTETLVSTISNESRPRPISNDEILYLGEESGIRSIYRYSLATGKRQPVTNFPSNIQDFDYSLGSQALAFVPQVQARDLLYVYPKFELPTELFLGKTARQQTLEARSQPAPAPAKPAAPAPAPTPATDAAPATAATPATEAATTPTPATVPADPDNGVPQSAAKRRGSNTVNTNDYQFEDDDDPAIPVRPRRSTRTAIAPAVAKAAAPALAGPYRYDTRFMADNLLTGIAVDPLIGFGISLQANLSDAFENQRIQANLFGQLDLRTSNISLSYTNVTHRVDWGVTYQKQAYFLDTQLSNIGLTRYGRHRVAPTVAYPLTHNLSVRGGPLLETVSRTQTGNTNAELDTHANYLGYNAELVFDNSRSTGVNMLLGTRMKMGIVQQRQVGNSAGDFGKFYIDLRHYQKLHRQLVWANRASFGSFFGPNIQTFRLGGMDNWLFQKYSDQQLLSPLPDPTSVFNQQFVTNMRGFDLSQRTGRSYVLFNSELRFPIVQYLSRRPIYSGFFRNLEFIGFLDAGTAYSGGNPFSESNSNNTVPFKNNTFFSGEVINYRNPLLVGYGVGVRTTVLGFYTKFDLAWGEENGVRTSPKPYLTLGHDF
jgi:WD40 repeat protein